MFEGARKAARVYSFENDLTFEEYLALLEEYFRIEKIIEAPAFTCHSLSKTGDSLDSKIIIAIKK